MKGYKKFRRLMEATLTPERGLFFGIDCSCRYHHAVWKWYGEHTGNTEFIDHIMDLAGKANRSEHWWHLDQEYWPRFWSAHQRAWDEDGVKEPAWVYAMRILEWYESELGPILERNLTYVLWEFKENLYCESLWGGWHSPKYGWYYDRLVAAKKNPNEEAKFDDKFHEMFEPPPWNWQPLNNAEGYDT